MLFIMRLGNKRNDSRAVQEGKGGGGVSGILVFLRPDYILGIRGSKVVELSY